ncbi:RHS repeat-associated core domain-containing protein [Mesorhizobium sp. NBSH29]|uniref:RHS repeat-associated core domain-containing protein n=1 Tax=Mesorhizobium sp. NBSH29 TaxID=2654249 RepID=UPI001AEEFAE5|nr:RHS repeat-associated core domain-containing protein [Mesorhizobium sp. NBSH29]
MNAPGSHGIGYNGNLFDGSGYYHLGNGFRAYNPALMRFHSPDSLSPFGKGGLNAYAYCMDDPVNRVDPSGGVPIFSAVFKALNRLAGSLIGRSVAPSLARRGSTLSTSSVASGGEIYPHVGLTSPNNTRTTEFIAVRRIEAYHADFKRIHPTSESGRQPSSLSTLSARKIVQKDIRQLEELALDPRVRRDIIIEHTRNFLEKFDQSNQQTMIIRRAVVGRDQSFRRTAFLPELKEIIDDVRRPGVRGAVSNSR